MLSAAQSSSRIKVTALTTAKPDDPIDNCQAYRGLPDLARLIDTRSVIRRRAQDDSPGCLAADGAAAMGDDGPSVYPCQLDSERVREWLSVALR